MATNFAKLFARTAAPTIMRQFKQEEQGEYHPRAGGVVRCVDFWVQRNQLEIMQEIGDAVSQSLIVRVINDATLGIDATEVDTGGDRFLVALTEGGVPVLRTIVRLLNDTNGFTRLLIQ